MTTVFHRAPCLDSPDQVVAWLAERGCTQIEVHRGPDGSYRGSGIARSDNLRSRRSAAPSLAFVSGAAE